MSEKHTQGRLAIYHQTKPSSQRIEIHDVASNAVAKVFVDTSCSDRHDQSHANARRLVACWNACEGVPTEVLQAQQSGGLPWRVADQIEQRAQFDAYKEGSEEAFGAVVEQKRKAEESVTRMESTIETQQRVIFTMRAQRDELLAALEDLHGQVRNFCETQGEADFETGRAVAVIAKVRGG